MDRIRRSLTRPPVEVHYFAIEISERTMDERLDLSAEAADEADQDIQLDLRLWLKMLTCTTMISAELRRQLRDQFEFTLPRFDMLAQLDREPGGLVLTELSKAGLTISPLVI